MAANEFEYIEAGEVLPMQGAMVVTIADAKSFIRFASGNQVKYVFRTTSSNQTAHFFFALNSILYQLEAKAYQTLNDMQQAQSGGFASAKDYYEAVKVNCTTYDQYLAFRQTGIENKEVYDGALRNGFIKGFEKFKAKYSGYRENKWLHIEDGLNDASKLYEYALKKGIKTFDEFEKLYDTGFPDPLTYNDAVSKGFKQGNDYYSAAARGFSEQKDFADANHLAIHTKKEYDDYRHFEDLNRSRNYSFDKLHLLTILLNREHGEEFTVAQVKELLREGQEKYMRTAGPENKKILPMWYSRGLDQEANLESFLRENEELKKFGSFNNKKKTFAIVKGTGLKIFVDGSNVAHNSNGNRAEPQIKNILLVVKELNFWKFKDITVFYDATLKHKVKDYHLLKELAKVSHPHEVPAKTPADLFLIESVKKEKVRCLIVTNDQFNEWRKKDNWLDARFDKIRVPFAITQDEKVILKGMAEHRNEDLSL